MKITHNLKIDLARPEIVPPVAVSQGDAYTREVKVALYANGVAWTPPAGHDVAVRYRKPDGATGIYDTLPDGSAAWSSKDNTVTVTLCPQMLTCPGKVSAQVSIIVGSSIISTFTFFVIVEADPSKGAVRSENYNNWRKAFLPQTTGAKVGQFLQISKVDDAGRIIEVVSADTATALPHALTINGKSYNGSAAVSLTIDAGDATPDYVRAEAERLAAVAQGRKNPNAVTFLACSDLHHSFEISNAAQQTESIKHLGQAMGIVRQQVQIDFAAVLGDLVWDHGESVDNALRSMRFVNSCIHDAFVGIPNFRDRGNHECLYNGDGLSDSQIYANIFAYNSGAVFGDRAAGYCYRDFEDHKLRVICINTCESNTGAFAVSEAQIAWLSGALSLAGKGDGWRSIVLGHHPPDWVSSSSKLVQTLKSASGLIAVFHGHVHGFRVDNIPGTEITRIAIPNACFGRENEYGQNSGGENAEGTEFGEEVTYSKTAGTAQDTAFCVVTIDLAQKKIYADHYGAGYSRVIPFDDVVLTNYTVTKNLTNVSISNAAVTVTEGASYTAVLTAAQGYELDVVTVTMGGVDITAAAYSGGVVSIQSVTGDVVITAVAVATTEPEEPVVITNLVTTSIGTDGSVFNAPYGYQDGVYVSGTASPADAACVATGAILLPEGVEDIYIKGAKWDTTNAHVRFYAGDLATLNSHTVKADGSSTHKLSTYFDVTELGVNYYKWTLTSAGKSYLADRYYRLSLVGTGANLVITHDQPIT
jgi:hypothetical protein